MTKFVLARRAEGLHRFQLKIGGDPALDAARARRIVEATGPEDIVIGDANCGWRLNEAIIAARAMDDLPRFYFEQPCPTMEECIEVRRHTSLPMVYDEVVSTVSGGPQVLVEVTFGVVESFKGLPPIDQSRAMYLAAYGFAHRSDGRFARRPFVTNDAYVALA